MLDTREAPVAAHEQHQAFNLKPLWQRAAIVSAGPVANFLLAIVLFAAVHWNGTQEPRPVLSSPASGTVAERAGLRAGDWVQQVSDDGVQWSDVRSLTDLRWRLTQAALDESALRLRVTDRDGRGRREVTVDLSGFNARDIDPALMQRIGLGPGFSEPVLGAVTAGGPADRAGLRPGDRVLRVDGVPIADAQQLRERIRSAVRSGTAETMRWSLERSGQVREIEVTPRVMSADPASPSGRPTGRIDAFVGQAPEMVLVREGLMDGLVRGVERTWEVSVLTLRMLGRMLVGEASLKNLSGPLSIADVGSQSAQRGVSSYVAFLALVSVSLAVLNLLPLPMLDGGHLMYYLFEGLTGRPVPDKWLERLQRGGIALLLVLMAVALFNDVARLTGLH
jgi:regulator of sigma E protease